MDKLYKFISNPSPHKWLIVHTSFKKNTIKINLYQMFLKNFLENSLHFLTSHSLLNPLQLASYPTRPLKLCVELTIDPSATSVISFLSSP